MVRELAEPDEVKAYFESNRIQVLQQERISIQKKTFTKWINSILDSTPFRINNLFEDLSDGHALHKLLEEITGEDLGRMNRGKLRVQKMENVNRILQYISSSVKLESIGAEDIVDGNPRLVLGLIWTIVLRFQLQEVALDDESSEQRSAKEALLLWCQRNTANYPGVNVRNFTTSWINGLAFNALIHRFRPDLINFKSLDPNNRMSNLKNAFDTAKRQLGISKLLDPEDIDEIRPDEKSIMTYLGSFYHYFSKKKSEKTGGKRVGKIIGLVLEVQNMKSNYYRDIDNLLDWINKTIMQLSERDFPNTIGDIRKEMLKFNKYRTVEKPPKLTERSNIEVFFFNLQTRLRANNQKLFAPTEGKHISDINRAWEDLESVEHEREIALRKEMQRLEYLENLGAKFERKIGLHEAWLDDMNALLDENLQSKDKHSIEIFIKRQESLESDISAREDRFMRLFKLSEELITENYHKASVVHEKTQRLQSCWRDILEKLRPRQMLAEAFKELLVLCDEIDSTIFELEDVQKRLQAKESIRSTMNVETLLERHNLTEKELDTLRNKIEKTTKRVQLYIHSGNPEYGTLREKHSQLFKLYNSIADLCLSKRSTFAELLEFRSCYRSAEAELEWLKEKEQDFQAASLTQDLSNVPRIQKKQELLASEMIARKSIFDNAMKEAEGALRLSVSDAQKLKNIVYVAKEKWKSLSELNEDRLKRLRDVGQLQQYLTDANEAESWMNEKIPAASSTDYGRDEVGTEGLLQGLSLLKDDIDSYDNEIKRLANQCENVVQMLQSLPRDNYINADANDAFEETDDDEEKLTEIEVPQVRALYAFKGDTISISQGQLLLLKDKSNSDWWIVKNSEGAEGYVPANYVKETASRVVYHVAKETPNPLKKIQKKEKADLTMKPRNQEAVSIDISSLPLPKDIIQRQQNLNDQYDQLLTLAKERQANLSFMHSFHGFKRECDDLEGWINEQVATLTSLLLQSNVDNLQLLEKAFEQLEREMPTKKAQLNGLHDLADEIIRSVQNQRGSNEVIAKLRELNNKWQVLEDLRYKINRNIQILRGVTNFLDRCDNEVEWMEKRLRGLNADKEINKDLAEIKKFQKKNLELHKEMTREAVEIEKLKSMANNLAIEDPILEQLIKRKLSDVTLLWDNIKNKSNDLLGSLDNEYRFVQFMRESAELLDWAANMESSVDCNKLVDSVTNAEELLDENKERKNTIMLHDESYNDLQLLGRSLLDEGKFDTRSIDDRLTELERSNKSISVTWQEYNEYLTNCLDWQIFNRDYQQISKKYDDIEMLINKCKEAVCVANLDTNKRRYDEMEPPLRLQDDRIGALNENAQDILLRGHPSDEKITAYQLRIIDRREQVWLIYDSLFNKLVVIEYVTNYIQEVDEVIDWVWDKLTQIGKEDFLKDPTNTQAKLLKHENLEAEINANQDRVDDMVDRGQQLLDKNPDEAKEAKDVIDTLTDRWGELINHTENRRRRLEQNCQLQTFNSNMKDISERVSKSEKFCKTNVDGKDIVTIRQMYNKYKECELQMGMATSTLQNINRICQDFVEDQNFLAYKTMQSCEELVKRVSEASRESSSCKLRIEATALFHQFNQQVEDESAWIEEQLRNLDSLIILTDLDGIIGSQKRLQLLELEMIGHREIMDQIVKGSETLENRAPNMISKIKPLRDSLVSLMAQLKAAVKDRSDMLSIEYKVLDYLSKAEDLEETIKDKINIITTIDYLKNEETANRALTLHKSITLELELYNKSITSLSEVCNSLQTTDCDKKDRASKKQYQLKDKLRNLKTHNIKLKTNASSFLKCLYFVHQVDELLSYIHSKMKLAMSTDYGKSVDHVDNLWHDYELLRYEVQVKSKTYTDLKVLSDALAKEESSINDQMRASRASLKNAWTSLQDELHKRGENLESAATTHRLYMDLTDVDNKIEAKRTALKKDVGKNLNIVKSSMRQHDIFKNSLKALEEKIKVIAFKVDRMHIPHLQSLVHKVNKRVTDTDSHLKSLKTAADEYSKKLLVAEQYYLIMNSVKELASWAVSMNDVITSEKTPTTREELLVQISNHEANGLEVKSKEDLVEEMIEQGQTLVNSNVRPSMDLYNSLSLLQGNYDMLKTNWNKRKQRLEQLHRYFIFEQGGQRLESELDEINAKLKQHYRADTPEEAETIVKQIVQLNNQTSDIKDSMNRLNDSNRSMRDQRLNNRMGEMLNKLKKKHNDIGFKASEKLKEIKSLRAYLDFVQRVEEINWTLIQKDEAICQISQYYVNTPSPEIRKHHLFQSVLSSCEKEKNEVVRLGQRMLDSNHHLSADIKKYLKVVGDKWAHLKSSENKLTEAVAQSKDMHVFLKDVEFETAWIDEKVYSVASASLGTNLQHNEIIERNFGDAEEGIRQNELYLGSITAFGKSLIENAHPSANTIEQKIEKMNRKWSKLEDAITKYKIGLEHARKNFAFNDEADLIVDELYAAIQKLQSRDYGIDLAQTKTLLRSHRRVEEDLSRIEKQIGPADKTAKGLLVECPEYENDIRKNHDRIMSNWNKATELVDRRRVALENAEIYNTFKLDYKYCSSCMDDIEAKISSDEVASSLEDAESAILIHEQVVDDLNKCFEAIQKLENYYRQNMNRPRSQDMKEQLEGLFARYNLLSELWKNRSGMLSQSKDLQIFMQKADDIEANLRNLEDNYLADDMMESSVDHINIWEKELNDIEKNIEQYDADRNDLEKYALRLVQEGHYDKEQILKRLNSLLTLKNRIQNIYLSRRTELEQLQQVKNFFAISEEMLLWINEKISIVNDASFSIPTNLPLKLEKRQAVEQEVESRKDDVELLITSGRNLLWKSGNVGQSIATRLNEVDDRWHYLVDAIAKLRGLLIASFNGQQIMTRCEDVIAWMQEVETEFNSNDFGQDVNSTSELLDRHGKLENQISHNREIVERILSKIEESLETEHLLDSQLKQYQVYLRDGFEPLSEMADYRRAVLEEYLKIHRFIYSRDKEMLWMQEKEPLVNSTHYGKDLNEVKKLLHKHEELQTQINEHDELIDAVFRFSFELTFHYSSHQYTPEGLERSCKELMDKWSEFKYKSTKRRDNLQKNMEIQVLIFSMNEIEISLGDMKAEVLSTDYGVNEQMSQVMMQNIDNLQKKLDTYHERLSNIEQEINKLDENEITELSTIKRKYASLAKVYSEIFDLANKRHDQLSRILQAHLVSKQVDKLYSYLKEKELSSILHDPCRDLDHVENVQNKLIEFYEMLEECKNQILDFHESANLLGRLKQPDARYRSLQERLVKVEDQLNHLYELAERRKQYLTGAFHLHTYYHDVDEIVHWIIETEKTLGVDENNAESINLSILRNKHEQLKEDIGNSVNLQIETVASEKQYLIQTFPDEIDRITEKHKEMLQVWSRLLDKIMDMDRRLEQVAHYQEFSREYRDLCNWISRTMKYINPDLSKSVTSLDETAKSKRGMEYDLSEYHDRYLQWAQFGEAMIDNSHFATNKIRERIAKVNEAWSNLQREWNEHKRDLDQNFRDQKLAQRLNMANSWLGLNESVLNGSTIHDQDSLDDIEVKLRKFAHIEDSVAKQKDMFLPSDLR